MSSLRAEFRNYVRATSTPCMMARAAERFDRVEINDYGCLGSDSASSALYRDIEQYVLRGSRRPFQFESFISVFKQTSIQSEREFESELWRQLQKLHRLDEYPWDSAVRNDPESANFSFSVAGAAFYVVGLHPRSSRASRRFKYPAIAFNYHRQFEELKTVGKFERVKAQIRRNDQAENGSINPMLEDFGESSEARQYSGRSVEQTWTCPVDLAEDR